MPVVQAHVDGNGLEEDLLQPVLDSLSQLFKDSNHKVLSVVWDSKLCSSITFILTFLKLLLTRPCRSARKPYKCYTWWFRSMA